MAPNFCWSSAEVRPNSSHVAEPNRTERSAEFFGRSSAFAELRSISISHLKCLGFVCPKNTVCLWPTWEGNTGSFRSVILARLLYASPACWGFAGVQDRQKLYGFLHRSSRLGFYFQDLPNFDDLCHQADNSLFRIILYNSEHVLQSLLPFLTPCTVSVKRTHDSVLPDRLSLLADSNFIVRMLFVKLTDNILYISVLFVQPLSPFHCCNCVLSVS